MALASSLRERPVRTGTVLAGELSLAGRIRQATRAERRLAEARRLGFETLITGQAHGGSGVADRRLLAATDVREAVRLALEGG
jgi:DNA repair protein RadA/Sms